MSDERSFVLLNPLDKTKPTHLRNNISDALKSGSSAGGRKPVNNNADLIQEDYSPYTLEGALKTNEINSIYRNTYPYVGLFNNTVKGGA